EAYGLRRPQGAIVTDITQGGPADEGGLEVGDLITAFNGREVNETRDLSRIVASAEIGGEARTRIIREGDAMSLTLIVGALDEDGADGDEDADAAPDLSAITNVLGVKLRELTAEDRRRYRIPASIEGVIVYDIEKGSDAVGKLSIGDVVTEVSFQAVSTPEDALAEAEAAADDGRPILIQIFRDGDVTFRSLRPIS
ncbi:MAG: PDZ domain-containing protein, partial [Pseudomonadota bacterium]